VRGSGTVPGSPASGRALSVSSEPATPGAPQDAVMPPPSSVSLTTTPTLTLPPALASPSAPRAVDAPEVLTSPTSTHDHATTAAGTFHCLNIDCLILNSMCSVAGVKTRRGRPEPLPSSGSESDSDAEAFADETEPPLPVRAPIQGNSHFPNTNFDDPTSTDENDIDVEAMSGN
jgi:hypothetical protein